MNINLRFFDKDLIKTYLLNDKEFLDGMIDFMKHAGNTTDEEIAKVGAIVWVQDECYKQWQHNNNNSSNYYWNEYAVYQEVRKRQMRGIDDAKAVAKAAEARRHQAQKNNEERIQKLKQYCQENNLNFQEENKQQLQKYKKNNKIASILNAIRWISCIVTGTILWNLDVEFVEQLSKTNPILGGAIALGLVVVGTLIPVFVFGFLRSKVKPPLLPDEVYKDI